MNKFQEIKELVANMESDADKFYEKKNKAAGVRLRRDLQRLKILAQEGRTEVLEVTKAGE